VPPFEVEKFISKTSASGEFFPRVIFQSLTIRWLYIIALTE